MNASTTPENKSTVDTKADKNPPLFSRAYGSELGNGVKSGLKVGVTIAATVAPTLLVAYGFKALFSIRD